MLNTNGSEALASGHLVDLVYELLDAHGDTMRMIGRADDPAWAAHLDYLRDLQRVGRETLARVS
jgi:hypothetical protein